MNAATQAPSGLHRARVLNTLLTKTLSTAAPMGHKEPNPATLQRPGHVNMDEGRPWSGDQYDEGAVSDPGESYASFGDGDVEAWLDKGEDGVLIGWVRDGDTIYRYSDADAWGIDVDGAGLGRTDGGAMSLEGEQVPEGAGDELAEGGEDMLDDVSTADASIGDLDPVAFEDEDDDATDEGDPTATLEDPTALPETTGDGGDAAQGAFADMLTDDTLPGEEPDSDVDVEAEVDPADDPDAEPEVEGDPDIDPIEDTAVEGDEDPDPDADAVMTIAPEDLPTADDEDPDDDDEDDAEDPDADADEDPDDEDDEDDEDEDEDEDEEGKKRPPFQRKHYPGEHNQESHGNRVSIGMNKPRASRSTSPPDTSAAGGTSDSTAAAPKKVSLSKESVAAMSDKDLNAIMEDGKVYDDATMMAASAEWDDRDPLNDKWKQSLAATAPGSLEEHNLLRDVLPPDWIKWAATDTSQKTKSTKGADREDEWLSFAQAQYLAALDFTNGQFFRSRFRAKPPFGEFGFFDGSITAAQAKKYMSRELAEWWDNHGVTKTEFMDQFSDRAQRGRGGKRTEMYT